MRSDRAIVNHCGIDTIHYLLISDDGITRYSPIRISRSLG